MRGDDISNVVSSPYFYTFPDDVRLMASILLRAQSAKFEKAGNIETYDVENCGTAMRFLTAFFAAQPNRTVVLTGCERMLQRPIMVLVDALRELGATVEYLGCDGFPPLKITGTNLANKTVVIDTLLSSQYVSALLLVSASVETNNTSPYIALTREVISRFRAGELASLEDVERDWSGAAFWLERETLFPSEQYSFPGLSQSSAQGDRVALELFESIRQKTITCFDFSSCPDLYPAAAVACYELGLSPMFVGLESLRIKESDRIEAISENFKRIERKEFPLLSYNDHRIAMAFLAAGYPVDDELCISKSYPDFVLQLRGITRIIPRRGVNDDNKGKKYALEKLISAATTEYVWLGDDDVRFAPSCPPAEVLESADLIILPLTMTSKFTLESSSNNTSSRPSLLERLQMMEYAAIQNLTISSAQKGRAVMCSGANMIVRRSAWLECKNDLHPEIPSGDDMFLLEAMKRRGMRIRVLDEPQYEAVCTAVPSMKAFLRQRMRWAGKAPAYSDKDILRCGFLTALSNVLAVICPIWLIGKWIVDMRFISSRLSASSLGVSSFRMWIDGLLLTIIYPWYMLICLIGGLFRRKKW